MSNVPMERKKVQKGTGIAGNVGTTLTVPAGERWKLLNIKVTLTTDATVANRNVYIEPRDIVDAIKFLSASQAQAESLTIDYYFNPAFTVANAILNALGDQFLDPGEDLTIVIAFGVAGDSYNYLVEYLKVEI